MRAGTSALRFLSVDAETINLALALLEPEELPELLRALTVCEHAGWVTGLEARRWRLAIHTWAIGLRMTAKPTGDDLFDSPGACPC